jgi:gamma-glutamyltranspeptidase/glutathione hydrolase
MLWCHGCNWTSITVAHPYAGNMVADLWSTESKWRKGTLDYRESTLAATKDMFLTQMKCYSWKAPKLHWQLGTSRVFAVHKKLGSSYRRNFETSYWISRTWCCSHHKQEERLNDYRQDLTKINGANSVLLKSLQGKTPLNIRASSNVVEGFQKWTRRVLQRRNR